MGGTSDMKRKGCESIGSLTHFMNLNFELRPHLTGTLILDFKGQNLKRLFLRNWRVDWHRTEGIGVGLTIWPWVMTLILDFQGQILKKPYVRNGRADWHGTKGMRVDKMLNPLCDLELWSWPWIFKVELWNSHIPRIGPIDMERKRCESLTLPMTLDFDFQCLISK